VLTDVIKDHLDAHNPEMFHKVCES